MVALSDNRLGDEREGRWRVGFRLSNFGYGALWLPSRSSSLLLLESMVQYSGKNISPSSIDILRTPIGSCFESRDAGAFCLLSFTAEPYTRLLRSDEARFAHGSSYVKARTGVRTMKRSRDGGSSISTAL